MGEGDPGTQALWAAHLARVSRLLAQARAVPGDLRLARFDRFRAALHGGDGGGCRGAVRARPSRVTELGEYGAASGPGRGHRSRPVMGGMGATAGLYTGRPSLYLNEVDRPTLQLPQGSLVTVRFYGEPGIMSVVRKLCRRTLTPIPRPWRRISRSNRRAGLSVRGPAGRDWEITALTDAAARRHACGAPVRERGGLMRQDYAASR